jgi:hypothetical protein
MSHLFPNGHFLTKTSLLVQVMYPVVVAEATRTCVA